MRYNYGHRFLSLVTKNNKNNNKKNNQQPQNNNKKIQKNYRHHKT